MLDLPSRQMAQSFGQRFLALVTRRPIQRAHNPTRPFPTFRQTACLPPTAAAPPQNPPSQCSADTPAAYEIRTADAALPAIDQLNPRCYGPVPISDRMRRMMRAQLPSPVIHFGPRPKSPQYRSRSSSADCLQFSTPPAGSRPQTVRFQRSVRRQLRCRQRRLPQPFADRTLDADYPVPCAARLMAMSRFFGKPLAAHFLA